MTDKMFMDWIKMRLTPDFKEKFGEDKKMILVLDNATYHHGYKEEVKVLESNSNTYNTSLLQNHGVKRIRVERKSNNCQGQPLITTHNFEVPEPGGSFPCARSACGNGVSKEEVALATRIYFQVHHPEKLLEKVEAYVKEKGWELIWTPPYMPTFQPIGLFWQDGKQYISLWYESGRKLETVWEQIRKGWCGDPARSWQEGSWKAADCGRLVDHVTNEMDKWVENDSVLRGSMGNIQIPDGYDKDSVCSNVPLHADGVGAAIEAESEAESEAEMSTVDSDNEEEL